MINWFGPAPWNTLMCSDTPRCAVPIGTSCARCAQLLTDDDCGVTMPGSAGPVAYHLDCHLKSVLNHESWPAAGLVPNASDGLVDGVFFCDHCGMRWTAGFGWSRVLR